MFTDKNAMLQNAPAMLNGPTIPWEITVDGDNIIARWKWMDTTWFAPGEVSDETREYSHIITLHDNGKYKEHDVSVQRSSGIGMGPSNGGSGGFGMNKSFSSFHGKQSEKSITIGLGRDHQTGQVGLVTSKFDTGLVKNQMRDWLAANGWKKAGLFG
jgi:hypothetical protein